MTMNARQALFAKHYRSVQLDKLCITTNAKGQIHERKIVTNW